MKFHRPDSFVSPFPDQEYTLMLCILDSAIPEDVQKSVSDSIVESGCRYAVCWGHECSSWDDSIDWSYLEATDFADSGSLRILTTWHEDESINDVVDYWWHNTMYDDYFSERFAIVFLGSDDEIESEVERVASNLESRWNISTDKN